MAKITYPSSAVPAYKGIVSELRSRLNWFGSRIDRAPDAAAEIGKQISAFLNAYAITPTVPSTQKVIVSGVKVLAPATTGAYVNGYTFTIVNGNITAVVAS